MAVGHDAASESAVSTSAASFSWTHTPGGTPRAAIIFVVSIQGTSDATSVDYGGTTATLIGTGSDTDTEPGTVECWFADNVPSGSQTITVNRVNDATQMMGMAATVTAAGATETYNAGRVTKGGSSTNTGADTSGTGTGSHAEDSVDDGSPGTDSVRYAAGYTGAASPPTAGTNSTLLNNHDFTAFGWTMVRETNPGQGSRSVGMTSGADDRALVAVAVREIPAAPPPNEGWTMGGGVW